MTTAAQHHQHHQHHQQPQSQLLSAETYDPDEVIPRDSPLMEALHPKLELSPSPPPDIPLARVSSSPPPTNHYFSSNRPKIRPVSGDAVLVAYLDNGRRPEIARAAAFQSLPDVDEEDEEEEKKKKKKKDDVVDNDHDGLQVEPSSPRPVGYLSVHIGSNDSSSQFPDTLTRPHLQNQAINSLPNVSTDFEPENGQGGPPDIALSTHQLSISEDPRQRNTHQLPSKVLSSDNTSRTEQSPVAVLTPASSGLPPLQMDSPKLESNGQILPSIRSTLGDIDQLPSEPPTPADKEQPVLRSSASHFTRSPPGTMGRLPPMSTSHISPPISPNEPYQLSLPSPRSLPGSSPYNCYISKGVNQRSNTDCAEKFGGESPNMDQAVPTPATSNSVADRMSIDGITHPQAGSYVCTFAGCSAPPFHTQYLLNSHTNVHSSVRPHYCPIQGCPRSEGGKGFKRKNEMIRHGLVHDSPGYVCPFCPDKEHKYPRPDNLQRHVRVHHTDKDKDDPILREVLSHRPEGPNRGRRRRGVAS